MDGAEHNTGGAAPTPVVWLLVALLLAAPSCALVEFELSPYAPRGLDVVYSHQEDMTFFVWRVGDEVDFDRVDFQLRVDGEWRGVEPEQAPFAHEPYECDRNYYCVQFQLDGRWSHPGDTAPLRAVDDLHGTLESPQGREYEVEETFSIEPLGVDNNERATARLDDWFEEEDIPLKRSFQWGLAPLGDEECASAAPQEWSQLQRRVDLPRGWMSDTPCFGVRPERRDEPGTTIVTRLVEGPMLFAEEFDETIPEIQHPIQLAFLVDLEVTNRGRCDQYVDDIRDEIFSTLDELDEDEDEPRDVDYEDLGVYRPIDPDGTEHSGCSQQEGVRYPVYEILTDADEVAAETAEISTLVVVYLNNLGLPPTDSKLEDLELLFQERDEEADPQHLTWGIVTGELFRLFEWDETTPWGPLEDDNFLPAIETNVEQMLPLRSTRFDEEDRLLVHQPHEAESPAFFRVCTISPQPVAVSPDGETHHPWDTDTWRWRAQQPYLMFDVPPQRFVNFTDFHHNRVVWAYEVCDEFCDRPFEGPEGEFYDSWFDENGVCQWD